MSNDPRKHPLSIVVVITAMSDIGKLDETMKRRGLHLQYRFRGDGTASSEVMDILGLSSREKTITICIVPRFKVTRVMHHFSDCLDLHKPGRGIAFAVPLSGVSSPVLRMLGEQLEEAVKKAAEQAESEGKNLMECPNSQHCLVLAIVNQGCSEQVMETAKTVGVTGGTIIHALRLGAEDKFKFLGISVQRDKDILVMLVRKEQRMEVMKLLGEKHGMHSHSQGLVLSLPVESVAGIGSFDTEEDD